VKRVGQLVGLKIYTDKAKYVGVVEDVLIDDRVGAVVGLVIGKRAEKAISVPYSGVLAVGDIIIVQSKKEETIGATA